MVNSLKGFTKKNQNSFSLFPAASFEDEEDMEAIFGAKNQDNDQIKSHGKKTFFSISKSFLTLVQGPTGVNFINKF